MDDEFYNEDEVKINPAKAEETASISTKHKNEGESEKTNEEKKFTQQKNEMEKNENKKIDDEEDNQTVKQSMRAFAMRYDKELDDLKKKSTASNCNSKHLYNIMIMELKEIV